MSEDGLTETTTDIHPAEKIADFLEENGWVQGRFRSSEGYCISGAGAEIFGERVWFEQSVLADSPYRQVWLRLHNNSGIPISIFGISAWNDTPGRTKEEVLRVLRGQG